MLFGKSEQHLVALMPNYLASLVFRVRSALRFQNRTVRSMSIA